MSQIAKEEYEEGGWSYAKETPVLIDGEIHRIQMHKGMTGIGSRQYWVDGNVRINNCVTQSEDLTKGNHYLYKINWRENPWDRVDIFVSEEQLSFLLDKEKQPEWLNPVKIDL